MKMACGAAAASSAGVGMARRPHGGYWRETWNISKESEEGETGWKSNVSNGGNNGAGNAWRSVIAWRLALENQRNSWRGNGLVKAKKRWRNQ